MINLNLFRRASQLGFVAGALALAFAAPSFAGGTDNPDVEDLNIALDATSGSSLDYNEVRFRAGQSADSYYYGDAQNSSTPGTYLKGYASNYDSETGATVRLLWFAFEPDSVKRTDTGASIKQKSNIALGVRLYSGSYSASATDRVEDCSAKGKIKIKDNGDTKASASLKCPKSVWEDLGFSAGEIEEIQSVLSSTKIKYGFKGNLN